MCRFAHVWVRCPHGPEEDVGVPWSWSCRCLWPTQCGCLVLSSGPLLEQWGLCWAVSHKPGSFLLIGCNLFRVLLLQIHIHAWTLYTAHLPVNHKGNNTLFKMVKTRCAVWWYKLPISALGSLRWEGQEFKASLHYIVRFYFNTPSASQPLQTCKKWEGSSPQKIYLSQINIQK